MDNLYNSILEYEMRVHKYASAAAARADKDAMLVQAGIGSSIREADERSIRILLDHSINCDSPLEQVIASLNQASLEGFGIPEEIVAMITSYAPFEEAQRYWAGAVADFYRDLISTGKETIDDALIFLGRPVFNYHNQEICRGLALTYDALCSLIPPLQNTFQVQLDSYGKAVESEMVRLFD